jgi:orotate phosphoribosyltransferase
MITETEVLDILERCGAVITGSHIVYTSGKHGSAYVNKDAVYPHTAETSLLCHAIAEQFADDDAEVVIGPAIGGVILAQWTAHHLSEITGRDVLGVYAEHEAKFIMTSERDTQRIFIPLPEGTFDRYNEEDAIVLSAGDELLV